MQTSWHLPIYVFIVFCLALPLRAEDSQETVEIKEKAEKCSALNAQDSWTNPKVWQICAYQMAQLRDYDTALAFIDRARRLYVEAGDMGAVLRMDEIRDELYDARFNAKWSR